MEEFRAEKSSIKESVYMELNFNKTWVEHYISAGQTYISKCINAWSFPHSQSSSYHKVPFTLCPPGHLDILDVFCSSCWFSSSNLCLCNSFQRNVFAPTWLRKPTQLSHEKSEIPVKCFTISTSWNSMVLTSGRVLHTRWQILPNLVLTRFSGEQLTPEFSGFRWYIQFLKICFYRLIYFTQNISAY
jgi:hypothetical protein